MKIDSIIPNYSYLTCSSVSDTLGDSVASNTSNSLSEMFVQSLKQKQFPMYSILLVKIKHKWEALDLKLTVILPEPNQGASLGTTYLHRLTSVHGYHIHRLPSESMDITFTGYPVCPWISPSQVTQCVHGYHLQTLYELLGSNQTVALYNCRASLLFSLK